MYKHIYTDNLLTRTYMCIHIKRYMNAYIYVYVCMHMTICIHMSAHMYTYMYIFAYIYIYIQIRMYSHVCMRYFPNSLVTNFLSACYLQDDASSVSERPARRVESGTQSRPLPVPASGQFF